MCRSVGFRTRIPVCSLDNFLIVVVLAAKFALEQIQPIVKEMDETSTMPQTLIDKLFENGVRIIVIGCALVKSLHIII